VDVCRAVRARRNSSSIKPIPSSRYATRGAPEGWSQTLDHLAAYVAKALSFGLSSTATPGCAGFSTITQPSTIGDRKNRTARSGCATRRHWLLRTHSGAIIRRQERDAPRVETLQGEVWECETLGLKSGWRKRRRRTAPATFRRCITRARARSPKRWSTWRGAKRSSRSWYAAKVARGRAIIPANIHHKALEPMGIGIAFKCKINSNIGNSATTSHIDEELKKLHHSVHYGADTVMDLSTGGDIPTIRKAIIEASPVPIGTVPIYEALSRVKRTEDLTIGLMLEVIEEQAEQGVDYMTIHAGCCGEFVPLVAQAHHGDREPRRGAARALDEHAQAGKTFCTRISKRSARSSRSTT